MNEDKLLKDLARLARHERVPRVDVTGSVLARIQAGDAGAAPAADQRALAWATGVAVLLAVAGSVVLVPLLGDMTNPVTEILIAALQV